MTEQYKIALNDRQAQAVFRALIEYRRILKLSEIKDSLIVGAEINAVDEASEILSLNYFTNNHREAAE